MGATCCRPARSTGGVSRRRRRWWFGWKLFLLAVGFGLVAYAGVDRERGPAFIGVAVLGVFALLTGFPSSGSGSLAGWPLFLFVIGAAAS